MTERPVRTVFLGSGAFAVPILGSLARDPLVELVGIVTAPPRPAGRGQEPARTPVHAALEAADQVDGTVIRTPERLRSPEGILAVQELDADLLVLADYGRIVPPELLERRHGALNLHPSLLPRHRGATPVPATILAGDAVTGVTLMRMDDGLDTGPIIAQSRWALDGDETTPELEAALADEAAALLQRSIAPWLAGELPATPQPTEGATLTRPLRREDGRLDAMGPVVELERQVRALQPWPGTFIQTPSRRIKVFRAEVMAPLAGQQAGTLTTDDQEGIAVATRDGRLRLLEVQSAGGRRMSGVEFIRGLRGWRGLPLIVADSLP